MREKLKPLYYLGEKQAAKSKPEAPQPRARQTRPPPPQQLDNDSTIKRQPPLQQQQQRPPQNNQQHEQQQPPQQQQLHHRQGFSISFFVFLLVFWEVLRVNE